MLPRTIGVAGAGQTGNGIAHVAAAAGFDVLLTDLESRFLEKARGNRPSPLLVRMVDAGWVGRKSGKGFYDYPASAS